MVCLATFLFLGEGNFTGPEDRGLSPVLLLLVLQGLCLPLLVLLPRGGRAGGGGGEGEVGS